MDEQRTICEDLDKMKKDSIQQPTYAYVSNTASGQSLNSVAMKLQNLLEASTVCVNESELEAASLDELRVVNAVDKGQNDDTVINSDKIASQLVLDTSNVDNIQTSYSGDIVFETHADICNVSSSSLAAEFELMSDISKGKKTPICEKNSTKGFQTDNSEQQPSPARRVSASEEVTKTHNEVRFFAGDQQDERTDQNQDTQKTDLADGSAEDGVTLQSNNEVINHSMSSLPQLTSEDKPPCTADSTSGNIGDEAEDIDNDCYIHQQTEIVNSVSKTNSRFEPIILNVCGGYHEVEADDINENQNLASLEATGKSQKSGNIAVKNTDTENSPDKLVSKSASGLLPGMILYTVSTTQNCKEVSSNDKVVTINKCKTYSDAKKSVINHALVHTETPIEMDVGNNSDRNDNCLAESGSLSTGAVLSTNTLMLSKAADELLSDNDLFHIPVKVPQSTSLKTPAGGLITSSVSSESAPGRCSQLFSNVLVNPTQTPCLQTTYSCVYVQEHTNGQQNKVALLVPQSSLSDFNYLASITSSVLSKMPLTELHTSASKSQARSVAPSAEVANNHTSVVDRISNLVTNVVDSFCLQGTDLKDTNLLKVVFVRKKNSLKYALNCSICGEGYHDEEGLNFHLSRTVFHLLFYCSHCKQKIVFYNKCSLWMHLRSESSKVVLNYNNILYLKPYEFVAEDSFENQMSETVDEVSSETSGAIHPNLDVSRGHSLPASTTSSIENVTESVPNSTVSVTSLSSRKRKYAGNISQCPICAHYFPDLSAHLCPATTRTFLCPSCGMFLPSICARDAHRKIHYGVAKDICCPECGESDFKIAHGDGDMRSVFDHVDNCKHFNRITSIQCFCKQELNNTDSLAEHFTENHFRTIFKCPFCVLAFIQHEKFVEHLDKTHQMKDTNIAASVLCLFCQHVLKSCAELKIHLDQHVEHLKIDTVFKWKCFICTKSFTDKAELNNHTEVDHPHKFKRCTICYSLFWSRKSLVEHIVKKKCLRFLAKHLNYCIDMQPDELNKSSNSVHLSKLFEVNQISDNAGVNQIRDNAEVNQISDNAGEPRRQLTRAPVVNKNPLLVKIAPKLVSISGQSVASLPSQSKLQQHIKLTQPVTLQKQTPTELLPSSNKVLQSQPKPQQHILLTKSVTLQKQTPAELLPSSNKVLQSQPKPQQHILLTQPVTLQKQTPIELLPSSNKVLQSQPKPQQHILLTQPVTLQKQTPAELLPSSNKVLQSQPKPQQHILLTKSVTLQKQTSTELLLSSNKVLQSQPKPQQHILLTQPVTLQKQTPTELLPSSNKVLPQSCKIIITSKGNSTQFRKSISVSRCVVCMQIMEITKLTEHLKCHQSQGVIICFHCQKRDFTTMEEAQKHSELCEQRMVKQAETELRSGNSKGEDKTPEANSGNREPNEQEQMEIEEKIMENQTHSVFPCLLCGLAFQSLSAREEHVSRSHDGTRIVYHCGLCRKKGKTTTFTRKELVSRHITKKHRIVNMDIVSRLIRTEELNASSGQKLQASKPIESVSAPKRLRLAGEGDYMCGKCGFSSSKSDEFSQHIVSHNSNKEPQCPECGLCFTVFPALKKHLLAVHKIHAVDDYLKTNNVTEPDVEEEFDVFPEIHSFNKPQPKSVDSGKDKPSTSIKVPPRNPLECTVCYKVFDIEVNLKTHMRNHGMAFIRSKRRKM